MHEELWGDGEPDLRPMHPLVSHTPVPHFDPMSAREMDPWSSRGEVVDSFEQAVKQLAALIPQQRFQGGMVVRSAPAPTGVPS